MRTLDDERSRAELLARLRRAEGQLRGIQRMIEDGSDCRDIAIQMSAVRRALDSASLRMAVCFLEQTLAREMAPDGPGTERLGQVLQEASALLGRIRA